MNTNRIWHIDLLRGLAVAGMIVFHFFYALNFFGIRNDAMYDGGWLVLARSVQYTFIGLAGVSLALSKSNYKKQFFRGIKIITLGLVVSLATYFFVPGQFVKFGILHFIGLSIIIVAPLRNKKYINLILGIIALFLGTIIKQQTSSLLILYIFGWNIGNIPALDYFPLFPWIGVILIGIFLGNVLKEEIRSLMEKKEKIPLLSKPLAFMGRHSLLVYMIHVPAIIFILAIFKVTLF